MAEAVQLEDWQVRQSKTFSKWVNMYLSKKGFEDKVGAGAEFGTSFDDGVILIKLMNALYDVKIKKHKKDAKTRVHRLDNVNQALKMVNEAEVKTTNLKQVNLLDGDFRMMCGMVWNIILDYNIKGISVEDKNAKTGLLLWCQKKTKDYQGIMGNINNFKKDWKNGNAFLALVDKHTIGKVNYDEMYESASAEEKLDAAFTTCEELGIPRLLEVEDLTEVEIPDDKAVMTYVSEMFKLFSKEDIKDNAREHLAKYLKFQRRMDLKFADYTQRYDAVYQWLQEKTQHYSGADAPETQTDCNIASDEFKQYILDEKPAKLAEVIEVLDLLSEIQGEMKVNHRVAYVPDENHTPGGLQDAVLVLGNAENDYISSVRTQRENLLEKVEVENSVSQERLDEWNKAFDVFDVDKSGHLNKDEYKAALSGVGVALDEGDLDANWSSMCTEDGFIERQQFLDYLTAFFTTSDTADSIMKSLQVLGDPEAPTDDMFIGMSEEDKEYLQGLIASGDGSLAAAIQASFASED